ncbi:hypothetical protein [Candidatus Hecatella orcuttiae]|jgi:hypothetical protein|uniref:hypothetical protein n=1 Tax=Candidatus Hecatella orcuttiae TaxID=1935119 RepID=UPI002867F556|nr:hypothetical protein [Candidatus Hecatella orcuttiae]
MEILWASLLSISLGIVIGFLASIAHYSWVQKYEKTELKRRIREELEIIRSDIASDLESGFTGGRNYHREIYSYLTPDLVRKLDAKTYRIIRNTYDETIHGLSHSPDPPMGISMLDFNKKRFKEAIEIIDKAIKQLR